MSTLDELLALLPDNTTGKIDAADLRTIVTELWDRQFVYNSYSWQYSNSALPPTGSQVRANNASLAAATLLEFRKIDNDGNDRSATLGQLKVDDRVRISDWDNASVYAAFDVTGPVVITVDTVQVPVISTGVAGVVPNAKAEVEMLWKVTI
jgi:hypothetical protein